MIPIQMCMHDREQMVQRIVNEFFEASPDQLQRGINWYPSAHEVAEMMCDGDVRQGAALLAAFSPQTRWLLNIRLACEAYETGKPRGHVSEVLSKANKILAGLDPEDILPMDRKTGQFYRCIVDPTDAEAVCIDRHAHDIAVGTPYGNRDRGLSAKGRYALVAHCYREAAQRVGELPMVAQAVTWLVWRERLAGTSTRGTTALQEV